MKIPPEDLRKYELIPVVSSVAAELGIRLYLVGGPVRDMLLGKDTLDYDFVVIGDLRSMAFSVAERLGVGREDVTFSKFLTASVKYGDISIDFAHARVEEYPSPAALPVVRPCYSIEEDLGRRDFTINAMAVDLSKDGFGTLIDIFGGVEDLKDRVIRVLHAGSFRDDPTRGFRAVRYARRFGFRYSDETLSEFDNARNYMELVSFVRVKNELVRSSVEIRRVEMFIDFSRFSLIYGMQAPEHAIRRLDVLLEGRDRSHWLPFYLLFVANSADKAGVLKDQMTRKEKNAIMSLILALELPMNAELSEIHTVLRNAPEETLLALAALRGGNYELYLRRRPLAVAALKGDDLIKLGVPRGQAIQEMLKLIEVERLNGRIKTLQDEIQFVKSQLSRNDEPTSKP